MTLKALAFEMRFMVRVVSNFAGGSKRSSLCNFDGNNMPALTNRKSRSRAKN